MKLWPTRSSKTKEQKPLVADLDALAVESVYFRMNGKDWEIPPLEVVQYLTFINEVQKFFHWDVSEETIDPQEIVERVHKLVSPVVKGITKKDVAALNSQQLGALIQNLISAITGQKHAEKKSLTQSSENKFRESMPLT